MGIFSHRTCSSGLPSQQLEVLKKDTMTPVLLLWFFAHVSEKKTILPGYQSETTISNALIIERHFFQMFWPQTWSKQNFKSLNHFTFLFLASFLQKWLLHLLFKQIKPQICWFITFSVLWNHHFSPFKSSTTGAAETHAVVCGRGLVPAAWSTARPLLGVWGGGNLTIPRDIWDDFGDKPVFLFFFRGNGRK